MKIELPDDIPGNCQVALRFKERPKTCVVFNVDNFRVETESIPVPEADCEEISDSLAAFMGIDPIDEKGARRKLQSYIAGKTTISLSNN